MKTKKRKEQLQARQAAFANIRGDGKRKRPSGYKCPGSLKHY